MLESRLRTVFEHNDCTALVALSESLSVSEKRTLGYLLAEKFLLQTDEPAFWAFFLALVPHDSKAHLMTFVKPAVALYLQNRLSINEAALTAFAENATVVDGRKLLAAFLPILRTSEEGRLMLQLFCPDDVETRLSVLLPIDSLVASYLLFQEMRRLDHDSPMIRHCCIMLMKRGGKYGFNMASALSSYFDVENLPGTFSLRLKTYQLSRLENSFQTFSAEISKI